MLAWNSNTGLAFHEMKFSESRGLAFHEIKFTESGGFGCVLGVLWSRFIQKERLYLEVYTYSFNATG